MPMATPEISSSGKSLPTAFSPRGCFVIRRYAPRTAAAISARQRASTPEDTGMCRTKGPRVPKITMAAISFILDFFS